MPTYTCYNCKARLQTHQRNALRAEECPICGDRNVVPNVPPDGESAEQAIDENATVPIVISPPDEQTRKNVEKLKKLRAARKTLRWAVPALFVIMLLRLIVLGLQALFEK